MGKKYLILLFVMSALLSGCATVSTSEGMDSVIKKYRQDSIKGDEKVINGSYEETFLATVKLLNPQIMKKDYDNKVILCNLDAFKWRLYSPLLVFFYEEGPDKTKIVIKGKNLAMVPYLPQKISDEVELTKKLGQK
jgi:hypothetical protein